MPRKPTFQELTHRLWLNKLLGLPCSDQQDLAVSDDEICIYLRTRYQKSDTRLSFTISSERINRISENHLDKELYWGFMFYQLSQKPSSKFKKIDVSALVSHREVWFLEWDWAKGITPTRLKTGEYISIRKEDFPSDDYFTIIDKPESTLYIPPGTTLEKRLVS